MNDTSLETGWRDSAHRVEDRARRVLDEASDAAPSFGEAARAAVDSLRGAGRKASAAMSDLTDDARGTRDQVVSQVRAQPVAAVLIAAGIGLVAGLIFSRR